MLKRIVLFYSTFVLIFVMSSLSLRGTTAQETTAIPSDEMILYDDFSYEAYDDPALSNNGWIVRTADGWPGVPGAVWRAENVTFVDDPDLEGNRLMQMMSSVEDGVTYQTQVCHQRKFYEGTYAARVHFTDTPTTGPDGDQMVETFYLISPQEYDMAPDYSELDYEYLPNGGWGFNDSVFFATTWETFQLEPWIADNISETQRGNLEGWHTLVIQIADGEANYYLDGEHYAAHGGEFYPEVPMSFNFNLWFINGGQIRSSETREYVEQIDWAYHVKDSVVSPDDINARVAAMRDENVSFTDSVPDWSPVLESPCNF